MAPRHAKGMYRKHDQPTCTKHAAGGTVEFDTLTHWGWDKMAATWSNSIFKCSFVNKNVSISIKIPLNFVPKRPIDNKWSLAQVMAWRRTGDKPLPEAMMSQFNEMMHICVTQPQWVNTLVPRQNGHHFAGDSFKCVSLNENVWISLIISLRFVSVGQIQFSVLIQVMAWCQTGVKPLSELMMA